MTIDLFATIGIVLIGIGARTVYVQLKQRGPAEVGLVLMAVGIGLLTLAFAL